LTVSTDGLSPELQAKVAICKKNSKKPLLDAAGLELLDKLLG
jgi:hypothetical protein